MTGHATHFLERLDRLEREEIELALLLYNQPELLAQVLAHLRIPADAPRVALSFADGGPYLVVTRDGHFVTCLAKGMSTTNLFVVSHARLLVAADKVAEMRRRIDLAKSLAGEARWAESGIVPLYETLHVAPRAVSREVMMGLSPFAAILSKVLAASVDDEIQGLDGIEKRLATNLKRMGSLGREYADVSTKMLFHMIHQMVVVSMAELQRIRIEGIDGGGALVDMTFFAAPVPWLPLWSRAAYLLGKFGKEGLSALKRGYLESKSYADLVLYGAGLIVASLRHRRLATEIEKTLQRHVSPQQAGTPMHAMGNVVLSAFRAHHEGSLPLDHHREALFNRLVARMPAAHPDRPRAASDLPDHVVVAWLANTPGDLLGPDRLVLAMFFEMLGALADADAFDLYLPAAYLPWLCGDETDDAYAARVIDTWRTSIGAGVPQPKSAPPTPGRNDPCSCGSGRKFKKCCG